MGSKELNLHSEKCNKFHTREEVADQLGVTVRTVYNLKKRGLNFGYKGVIECRLVREFVLKGELKPEKAA